MAAPKKKVSAVKDSLKEQLKRLKRELDVEVALERVRVRATAMRGSDELAETSSVLFHQLKKLKIKAIRTSVGIFDDPNDAIELWITALSDKREVIETLNYVNLHVHPVFENLIPARKQKKPFALTKLTGKAIKTYYQYLSLPDQSKYNETEFFYSFFFSQGTLNVVTKESLTDEQCAILVRFASVFGLIYTRFLDLQRAEAQAREAQIELALERVRKRTMTMNKSDELSEVAGLLYEELHGLGLAQFLNCGYVEVDEKNQIQNAWMTNAIGTGMNRVQLPLTGDPVFDERYEAWQRKEKLFHQSIGGALLKSHIEYGTQHYRKSEIDQMVRTRFSDPTYFYCSNFSNGYLHVITSDSMSEEDEELLVRFTDAFELTYKRFLDLKNAEAQAREAQIEAALERVRSRSMAMHKSEELADVIVVIADQLAQLNIRFDNVSFAQGNAVNDVDFWISVPGWPKPYRVKVPFINNPNLTRLIEARQKGLKFHQDILTPKENKEWTAHVFAYNQLNLPDDVKAYMLKSGFARSVAIMPNIMLVLGNYLSKPYGDEVNQIILRFASVFEQSYTRFLDLQKAEHQTREAQIEAALERVRSRSMGMHKSEELADVISVVSEQLQNLQIRFEHASFVINSDAEDYHFWTALYGKSRPFELKVPYLDHPIANSTRDARARGLTFFSDTLTPDQNRRWLEHAFAHNPDDYLSPEEKSFALSRGFARSIAIMPNIMLAVGNYASKPYSDSDNDIIKRFAAVFEQSYTRFLDLQKAEAQTRDAMKQASLDRVRAEIAAMRTTTDLQRITPLVWRELKTLGVPFFRCGVLIVDEPDQKLNYYLSTPEGRPLAALHLDFNTELDVVRKALEHWREQTTYIDHWTRDEFLAFAQAMIRLGQVETIKSYQGGEQTPESITLQFVPFAQGMLYVGSAEGLTTEQIELVHALADAFSTAYARYEDFVRLEIAKEKVESTLSDLRATQNQLIQSEKMASLGELTAGIAHEIQNPLNFVNNFSEVNKELLAEMEEAIHKGNYEEAASLAKSVSENQAKINMHGKRAEGIVKGMLQHSRTSTGQKETTDINALCDEYLRLAYHGLRAKDKSFNAKFETDFDAGLPKAQVVAQDMGRVVLNLINNAFYAVKEKSKLHLANFEPRVLVRTKYSGEKIFITVEDNGIGIPGKVKEKIFQPFFTTKPTGQGTGLGLSLSYDIVKAHGGELVAETREGEGTTFSVELPLP